MINFLSVLFFIGILIASLQDLKRREVDNYLNFFLLVSGAAFLAFSAVLSDWKILIFGALSFLIMFSLANIFYYGRIFAGGDAKLMIAMFSLFAAVSLSETLINIGSFIFLLMISGQFMGFFTAFF
jgi:Flp pilus assembly protein protease CpaA